MNMNLNMNIFEQDNTKNFGRDGPPDHPSLAKRGWVRLKDGPEAHPYLFKINKCYEL